MRSLLQLIGDQLPTFRLIHLPASQIQTSDEQMFFFFRQSRLNYGWTFVGKFIGDLLASKAVQNVSVVIGDYRYDDSVKSDIGLQCLEYVARKWREKPVVKF